MARRVSTRDPISRRMNVGASKLREPATGGIFTLGHARARNSMPHDVHANGHGAESDGRGGAAANLATSGCTIGHP
ncbi:hypothetical protein DICSQDRAFT_152374 [Dichomitus squalens LYAD-421 SS1]|uniref:uncharacterized protein n=1 Tax=Dichomitus squalens (strain LYAD-421) TaxID=732165 RepID=UPI00044130F9|nr:uncharacterized protein DICSQDRAFT_152374 [Dichomitus squalens LYAD-421 SS1]EJF65086.1 hypothetical protein DICSQDRAFT_152374 [Dichomitus squalens LYAD-421 SS1]